MDRTNRQGPPWLHSRGLWLAVSGACLLASPLIRCGVADEKSPAATKPAVSPPAAAKKESWKSLFDGKSTAGWKSNYGGGDEITVEKGHIELEMADGLTGVTWQKDFPKINYEIRLKAMRVDGSDFFCGLTFPVQKDHCSLIVGGWGGTVVGLSSIDGEDAAHNTTTKYERFDDRKWYAIRVRVTEHRIQAWIDDKLQVDQKITGKKISIRPEIAASKPLGIASWTTTAAIKEIEYRTLTAEQVKASR